jgi:hypothetical protein
MKTEQELRPCERYKTMPLKFIELRTGVTQSTGGSKISSRTGIQFGFGSGYSTFGLNTANGAYLYNPKLGEAPLVFSLNGNLGQPHTLRIEWTDSQILFYVDGNSIYKIDSSTKGDWFLLTSEAPSDSDITANFYSLQWTYAPR